MRTSAYLANLPKRIAQPRPSKWRRCWRRSRGDACQEASIARSAGATDIALGGVDQLPTMARLQAMMEGSLNYPP